MTNKQEELTQVVVSVMYFSRLANLRGVTAEWRDETVRLNYYFDRPPTEEEREEASELSTEVLAGFWSDLLKEDCITLSSDHPLPVSEFWAYKRQGEQDS